MIPTATADSSADMNSLIDTVLDSAPAGDTPGAAPTPGEPATEPDAAEPAATEPQPEQASSDAQTQPAETQPDEFQPEDDLAQPDRVSRDGKLWYFKPSRIAAFKAAHQAWRTVQDSIPGATVDSLKGMYETATTADEMITDFQSGNVAPFAKFWSEENPQAFTQLMLQAPQFLAERAPQAYQMVQDRILGGYIDGLYREGVQRGDNNLVAIAQHLDMRLRGEFRDMTKPQPPDEGLRQRAAELQRREQAFAQQTRAEQQRRVQAFMQQTDFTVHQAVTAAVDKALQRSELKAFENKPQLKWMKRDLIEKVEEAEQANAAWLKQYEVARKQAETRPSEQTRQALVSMKEQFAKSVIARNLKAVIDAATGDLLSKSAAAHSKLAAAATRTEPANAANPAQGVQMNPKLDQAKSLDEVWKAIGW